MENNIVTFIDRLLWLSFPVFPIRDIFQPTFFAPFLDGALDGFGVESHRGGQFAVGLAVELVREGFKVFQL